MIRDWKRGKDTKDLHILFEYVMRRDAVKEEGSSAQQIHRLDSRRLFLPLISIRLIELD